MINKNIDCKSILQEKLTPYELEVNKPMKDITTFHIGGVADFFVRPHSVTQIMEILEIAKLYSYPIRV